MYHWNAPLLFDLKIRYMYIESSQEFLLDLVYMQLPVVDLPYGEAEGKREEEEEEDQ